VVFYGGSGNHVNISNSNDNNLDIGHISLGAARPKKKKTLPRPGHRTLAAHIPEALTVLAIGFSNTWSADTATVLVGSYPNWPLMQPQQLQSL
jgi:hypothetical protein